MKIRNKRGDINVVIAVFLALAIIIYTLFVFITRANAITSDIEQSRVLEQFYVVKGDIAFTLYDVAYKTVKVLNVSDPNFKEKFLTDFKTKVSALSISAQGVNMNRVKQHIASDNNGDKLKVNIQNNILEINIVGFNIIISDKAGKISAEIPAEISFKIKLASQVAK